MAAISETLRQARLRSGVDLDRLAAKTKINPRYLEAIEKGDFDKLPGGIFARMFIKQYADAVGLDGASFAEEFQRNSLPSNAPGNYSGDRFESSAQSRSSFQPSVPGFASTGDRREDWLTSMLSSLIWVVAAILVCAAAYYGLAHLPSRSSSPVAAETAPKPAKAAESSAKPQAPAATPVETKGEPSTQPATSAPNAAVPNGAPNAAAPNAANAASASLPIQLAISATDAVWVTAVADGKTVVSEVMQPGSSKIVTASKGVRVTLGNAGGADITFNGKKLEAFGPKGQVRSIDFSSFGAQVVSRTPVIATDPLQ